MEGGLPWAGLFCCWQSLERGLKVEVQASTFPSCLLGREKPIGCKQEQFCSRRGVGTLQTPPVPDPSSPLGTGPSPWDLPDFVSPVTPFSCAFPENTDTASPLPGQDPAIPEGDDALNPALCPRLDGSLKMPGKARAKQRPCCQGDADGDIVLLSTVYPLPEECNHSFPLPATELGATALVTTKTTQNCAREEKV